MVSKRKILVIPLLMIMVGLIVQSGISSNEIQKKADNLQETQLLIYTYESLLADPYYNIEGNFSKVSGISKDNIQILRFDDANTIVTTLLEEKDNPKADVVIGVDNALIHLIEDKSTVLQPYTPTIISQIDSNLITNLDPDKYLIPYDYGIISFYYHNYIINSSSYPELTNLTLDTLLDSDLLSMLIIENPKFSSPGLGFLLWTIAVYGDPEIDFDGLLKEDWRDWWRAANDSILITKSWGDAFDIFFNLDEGRPIMISYGTSPAYGFCQWADDSTSAIVTYEKNQPNAWLQIEGIGLVKNAPHESNAKEFIDWFLGKELQSDLPLHQWMYPTNTEANVSTCFLQSAISPDDVYRLNDLITPDMLKDHLINWQDEWEIVIVQPDGVPGFEVGFAFISFLLLTIPILKRRRNSS